MKNKFARAVAIVAAGSALALAGAGVADAGTTGGGSGTSSTQSAAAQVQKAREDLVTAANAGDVRAARSELAKLDPLLADLAAGRKYTVQATTSETAATAKDQAAEASKAAAQLPVDNAARADLPPVAGLLNALLQRLLLSLSVLVNDLLGGLGPLG